MERVPGTMSLEELQHEFPDIDFPEYQREPDVWSREQKQRLIDSILREFDVSSIYFYLRDDGVWECIDGRQRLNAIMSFFGRNPRDEEDNGFPLRIENEISDGLVTPFEHLSGLTYAQIEERESTDSAAAEAARRLKAHELTTILLSGAEDSEEFNLQFLRLNLGTLINAGEKLNSMVGGMREIVFGAIGEHEFFDHVRIPTRRFTKQVTVAQVLLQALESTEGDDGRQFVRARHVDLQRFFKRHAGIGDGDPRVAEVVDTLDALVDGAGDASPYLKNRAVTVSAVILAWTRDVGRNGLSPESFWEFFLTFMGRLRWQVGEMKQFRTAEEYSYLVDFQRHLTQASVEKPAVQYRHQTLSRELDHWLESGSLSGDSRFRERTGTEPPSD